MRVNPLTASVGHVLDRHSFTWNNVCKIRMVLSGGENTEAQLAISSFRVEVRCDVAVPVSRQA